ncbi:MAG: asparagine synthase-related protein, partial [Raineya sp.]|nr:asparagine synthase-related protein [Raineya sp.]
MLQSTLHRGKEAHQWKIIPNNDFQIFIGHNLLQINTTNQAAFQPFTDEKKRFWLIFNGEIYNFKEIDKKFNFTNQSHSDTETLWNYLQKVLENNAFWGELDGIFAFIFYDCQEKILLTARDEWGVKPLYIYQNSQLQILTSEVQSFWASGLANPQIRKEAITEYLLYKFALPPNTFFENIYTHPTALQVHYLAQNKTLQYPYKPRQTYVIEKNHKQYLVEQTQKFLENSIIKQIQGAFNPALLLSGGVDSTLLLALSQKLGYHLPAFSVCTNEKNFTQDAFYIQKAQEIYGVKI